MVSYYSKTLSIQEDSLKRVQPIKYWGMGGLRFGENGYKKAKFFS